MVVGCVAAATVVTAAAESSAGCGQSAGSLHGAARLLKWEGAHGLRRRVMDVVEEVVGVVVAVPVPVLRGGRLLRGRCLQAARMGVAQGQVTRGGPSARGVLLTAGREPGQGCARVFPCCTGQTRPAVIYWGKDT